MQDVDGDYVTDFVGAVALRVAVDESRDGDAFAPVLRYLPVRVQMAGDGAVKEVIVKGDLDVRAADFGAGSTSGGTAVLHVATITGTAVNAVVTVQSSPDGGVWTDEGTFMFSAVGGYVLALAGTVGRYVRLACASLGGATAIRCMAVVSLGIEET